MNAANEKVTPVDARQRERVLGVSFFNNAVEDAVAEILWRKGCLVIPASPALIKLNYDKEFREALRKADVVLPDSGLLARLWKLASGRKLNKISGIDYLRCLCKEESFGRDPRTFVILPSEAAKEKAIAFFAGQGCSVLPENCPVISDPGAGAGAQNHELLLKLEERRPQHVVIALHRRGQESLGIYLRDYLLYRPAIHCVGAALALLSGDQAAIPEWAQRYQLGWFSRLLSQPRMILPRFGIALALAGMVFRYRSEMPPLRARWTDL
ncbi:MAG: WecB/TagA/CpsF family glycosyltransferase [Verrucomicrobiota bacterium]|nr:WecB/TagA/CpsF family glycosyltransferase [Verrucomicrobiota bacterium]